MAEERTEWVIEVGGNTYDLSEKGYAQLQRLSLATKFIDLYGKQAVRNLDVEMEGMARVDTFTLLISLIGNIDEKGFLWLGRIVTLEDEDFVKENFDLEWIVEGLRLLLTTPSFKKIRDSFFGGQV